MLQTIAIALATLFLMLGLLRKVNIGGSALSDNVASFTNSTGVRLHIKKIHGTAIGTTSSAIGDKAVSSLDEVPVSQDTTNDSRAHIGTAVAANVGGTGSLGSTSTPFYMEFDRNDLFLDPDESLFVNNRDIQGAMPFDANWNIWYED